MNMLNPEMRVYQSFDADGRNAIVGIVINGQAEQLNCNGDWINKECGTADKNGVYRLKLKEGDNVTWKLANNTYVGRVDLLDDNTMHLEVLSMGDSFIQDYPLDHDFKSFTKSTQAEQDSVRPSVQKVAMWWLMHHLKAL